MVLTGTLAPFEDMPLLKQCLLPHVLFGVCLQSSETDIEVDTERMLLAARQTERRLSGAFVMTVVQSQVSKSRVQESLEG